LRDALRSIRGFRPSASLLENDTRVSSNRQQDMLSYIKYLRDVGFHDEAAVAQHHYDQALLRPAGMTQDTLGNSRALRDYGYGGLRYYWNMDRPAQRQYLSDIRSGALQDRAERMPAIEQVKRMASQLSSQGIPDEHFDQLITRARGLINDPEGYRAFIDQVASKYHPEIAAEIQYRLGTIDDAEYNRLIDAANPSDISSMRNEAQRASNTQREGINQWRNNPYLQQNLKNRLDSEAARANEPDMVDTPDGPMWNRHTMQSILDGELDPSSTIEPRGDFLLGGMGDPDALKALLAGRRRHGIRDFNLVESEPITPEQHAQFVRTAPLDPEHWRAFIDHVGEHLGAKQYLWLRNNPMRTQVIQLSLAGKTPEQISRRVDYAPTSITGILVTARKLKLLTPARGNNALGAIAPWLAMGGIGTAVSTALRGGQGRGAILNTVNQDQSNGNW
jgi:hypothetical protein